MSFILSLFYIVIDTLGFADTFGIVCSSVTSFFEYVNHYPYDVFYYFSGVSIFVFSTYVLFRIVLNKNSNGYLSIILLVASFNYLPVMGVNIVWSGASSLWQGVLLPSYDSAFYSVVLILFFGSVHLLVNTFWVVVLLLWNLIGGSLINPFTLYYDLVWTNSISGQLEKQGNYKRYCHLDGESKEIYKGQSCNRGTLANIIIPSF